MKTASIRVRRGDSPDAAALAAFAAKTFADTFGADNRPEDMAIHLANSYGVDQQARELGDRAYITVLVELDGALAAYAQVRRRVPPESVVGPSPIELYRFYVDQPWHGRGFAQLLMSEVRKAANELGGRTLWLSVWERNPRARAFYAKCGFHDVGSAEFVLGTDPQTDRILVASIGK